MPSERETLLLSWLEQHRGIVYRLARAYTVTPEDRADLIQEMSAQLWRSIPGFKQQCQPVTWVYRVCLNTALGWRRDFTTRNRALPVAAESTDAAVSSEPHPRSDHEHTELLARLYESIRTLPKFERSVVLLHLEGLSYREIHETLGISENHIGVLLTRARQKLGAKMKEVRNEL
ncbi:MAG TPA: sigma-70 family RNA polymerase sigma factor [Opitutaceae bacterium]|nr:sigma-70 family RNA polymerase sigma factor [Opitutaceae bacterium]